MARPEWCLAASSTDQQLLNLGHPDALDWTTNRISQVITEQGVDVFRSDFNMDPLDHGDKTTNNTAWVSLEIAGCKVIWRFGTDYCSDIRIF